MRYWYFTMWRVNLEFRGADGKQTGVYMWFRHLPVINLSTLSGISASQYTSGKEKGTDNKGDEGRIGYISIRYAKGLHFTLHEYYIEANFTPRASCFPDIKSRVEQYTTIIDVCMISMQIQFVLYLTFQNCMATCINHCTCAQSTLSGTSLAQQLSQLLIKIYSSLHHVLLGITHISRC